jgi:hypothetical protein
MSVCLSSEGSLWTATRALGSGGCGNRELLQPRERLAPAALRAPACVACLFRPGAYLLFFMTAPHQLPSFVHSLSPVVSTCNPCRMSE